MNQDMSSTATIAGIIDGEITVSHMIGKAEIYTGFINSPRLSGVNDHIPIHIVGDIYDKYKDLLLSGKPLCFEGQLRSYNKHDKMGKSHLEVYLQVLEVHETNGNLNINQISLECALCFKSKLRETRKTHNPIIDFMIAVNRYHKASDYIPCLAWNSDAKDINETDLGTNLIIEGRLQSRKYPKCINPDVPYEEREYEYHETYEIAVYSVIKMEK